MEICISSWNQLETSDDTNDCVGFTFGGLACHPSLHTVNGETTELVLLIYLKMEITDSTLKVNFPAMLRFQVALLLTVLATWPLLTAWFWF